MSIELDLSDWTEAQKIESAVIELCRAGLLTCTHGKPGDEDAKYAIAWLPLDHPERFSADIQAKHTENMAKYEQAPL